MLELPAIPIHLADLEQAGTVTNFLSIIIAAALANNVVLVQFLGVSSLFAYSDRLQSAIEVALLSFFVLFVAALVNLLLFRFLLAPLNLEYLKLLCFVSISSGISGLSIHWIKQRFPLSLRRQKLAFYLIGGNSAVIGVALINTVSGLGIVESAAYSLGAALGFALLLIAFAALRQRLDTTEVPTPFRGAAIHLVSAGIIAMCFLGFAGPV